MKTWIRNLLVLGSVFSLLLINITMAKADLPPAIWHCASQEQCFALLTNNRVVVTREGVTKGIINEIGTGDGNITVSNGIIIVTRINDTMVYLYNLVNANKCSVNVTEQCYPGIVADRDGTLYAHVACPASDYVRIIPLNCSFASVFPADGASHYARNLATSNTQLFIGYTSGSDIGVMNYLGPAIPKYTTNLSSIGQIVYNDSSDALYMVGSNGQNGIFVKTMPIASGMASMFQSLPQASEYMSGSLNHLAVSNTMWDGQIIPISNPSAMVTVTLNEAKENAISPATPGEAIQAYFIEAGTSNVRVRVFDETGSELGFSPINTPSCDLAYIAPTLPPVCQNGLTEPGEICDSTDFDGDTCQKHGFDGGDLSCSASCDTVFTSGCWSCGDGTLNPGESCDGTNIGTSTCSDGGYASGSVSCNTDCTINYSQCYTCGNGLIEGPEQCEGADLNGADCTTEGFVSGNLTCDASCMYDVSTCSACGDNIANYGETCDATDTPGMICQTLGLGYTGGDLACTSSCDGYDDSGCYTCGDGNVNPNEECDGANLDGQDCSTLGLGSGTLSCFENCTFNLTQCSGVPTEYCGNGVIDNGEECDDGNRSNSDDCSENCHIIPPTCGLGGVNAGESCDGTDLNGATCESLGYQAGVLYCGSDCQFRTDDCHFESMQTMSLEINVDPESGELNNELAFQYESLKETLTKKCVSQDINGDLVITTVPGSYCSVRARALNSENSKSMFSFIYFPQNALENEAPVLRFYKNGNIAENFGGHITAYQGLQVKTVLVQDHLYNLTQEHFSSMGMKFLAVNPNNGSRGRWLAINIGTGSTSMCTDQQGENCAHLVPQQGQIIINLDALEDISKINWKPPKNSGGCSCETGNTSSTSFPLLFLFITMFLFWNRRRSTK